MVRSGAGHNLLLLGLPAPPGDDDDNDNNHYDDDDDDDDSDDVVTGERPTSYQPPLMQCSTPRAPIALPLISRSKSSSYHRICFASYVLISNQTNTFLSPTAQHVYPTPSYLCCFQLFLCVFTSNPK